MPLNHRQSNASTAHEALYDDRLELINLCLALHRCETWEELTRISVTRFCDLLGAIDVRWLEYASEYHRCIRSYSARDFQADDKKEQKQPRPGESITKSEGLDAFYTKVTSFITHETQQIHSLRNHFPLGGLEQLPFYQHHMRPEGVEDLIAMQCYHTNSTKTHSGNCHHSAVILSMAVPQTGFLAQKRPLITYLRQHLRSACQHLAQLASHNNLTAALGGLRQQDHPVGTSTVSCDGSRLGDVDKPSARFIRELGGWVTADGQAHLPTHLQRWVQDTITKHSRVCAQNTPHTKIGQTWHANQIRLSLYLRELGHGAILTCQQLQDPLSNPTENPTMAKIRLTPRELDVLCRISNGMRSQEVADSLNISKRTVDKHLEHIYFKLEVDNRLAAAKLYKRLMSDTDGSEIDQPDP